MAKKRITLPKNFKELIEAGDIAALKAVFEKCELDATGGPTKGTALGFFNVPGELVRWLVAQGANINATDTYNRTPLHEHTMRLSGDIDVFLELGADINAMDKYGNTPLHFAAGNSFNPERVRKLMEKGANALAKDARGDTPLAYALNRARGGSIVNLVVISKILLEAGTHVTDDMKKAVTRIGEDYEFHRETFNSSTADAALLELYQIYDVDPVKKRILHDGVSPIIVSDGDWKKQYAVLWDALIPSKGAAKTVQGEVIRITGRVRDEIYRNGGGNWDSGYKKMLDALLVHFASGISLDETLLNEAASIIREVRQTGYGDEGLSRLCELAVQWVVSNQNPMPLEKPSYNK